MMKTQIQKIIAIALIAFFAGSSMILLFQINLANINSIQKSLNTSDVVHVNEKYPAIGWWDIRFRFRIGFNIENLESFDRHEPVDVYLTFLDNEHFDGTTRLIAYNASGNDEWSNPIPIQVWNTTLSGSFILKCTITFIADVPAENNQTYFVYFNENDNGGTIDTNKDYGTGLYTSLGGGILTVSVQNEYSTKLVVNKGVTEFIRNGTDFFTDDSLKPEKQLTHDNLVFLDHFDLSSGYQYTQDSIGGLIGYIDSTDHPPQSTQGISNYALNFQGVSNSSVNYGYGALEGPGEPFAHLSPEFTITTWIYPTLINDPTDSPSNHGTENCIMAKASNSVTDTFEMGLNDDGSIHVWLRCQGADATGDFGPTGASAIIKQNQWNFVVVRYDQGNLSVYIENYGGQGTWFYYPTLVGTSVTNGYNNEFTIGSSRSSRNWFNGKIDEVAIYNSSLSDEDIDKYKYGVGSATIESITEEEAGQVFARYNVAWKEVLNMHVTDTCTFYYNYNLWNVNRTVWVDEAFNGDDPSNPIIHLLNTYYDFSGLSQSNTFYYFYDGNFVNGLTNDNFLVENYTVIHDHEHSNTKLTIGTFISDYSQIGGGSLTYLKGNVTYFNPEGDSSDQVRYTPGSYTDWNNNDNSPSTNYLNLNFWQYIDNINQTSYTPKMNSSEMTTFFDNIFTSLKTPMNQYIFEKASKFYRLNVNVTDIDGNLVPGANVTVYYSNYSLANSQKTDNHGVTTFSKLESGNYIVNVTYEKYGKTTSQPITINKAININENTVDINGLNKTSFTNVHLTSLNLTLYRHNSTDRIGVLQGAKVTFYIDKGAGNQLIGSEYSDINGKVTLRWENLTATENITFSIEWFDNIPLRVDVAGDLDGGSSLKNVTLPFNNFDSKEVNVTFGTNYNTQSVVTVSPDEDQDYMIGSLLNFQVNYTKTENGTWSEAITGATVTYQIIVGSTVISSNPTEEFVDLNDGYYNLTINTNNTIEPGIYWGAKVYSMKVTIFKSSYITQVIPIGFELQPFSTKLTKSTNSTGGYWFDSFSFDVSYINNSYGGSVPIDGATVTCSVLGYTYITGAISPLGNGVYRISFVTTQFPISRDTPYNLEIVAYKDNLELQTQLIEATISPINTLINGKTLEVLSVDVPFRELRIFTFNYTWASTGIGLEDSDVRSFSWTSNLGSSGSGTLTDDGNGLYTLDMNTETLSIGTYTVEVKIKEDNYAQRTAIIVLDIVEREFDLALPSSNKIINAISGQPKEISIVLRDEINGSIITGAEVYLIFEGVRYNLLDPDNDGTYTTNINLPLAFFAAIPISATLTINKTYYKVITDTLTINVGMVEIFPNVPIFYFIMVVAAIAAVVGSLVIYRYIQVRSIPTFVKKNKSMRKAISSKSKIGESTLYPSKDRATVKLIGDKWESIGLSLADILGIPEKKRKGLSDIKDKESTEGGGEI